MKDSKIHISKKVNVFNEKIKNEKSELCYDIKSEKILLGRDEDEKDIVKKELQKKHKGFPPSYREEIKKIQDISKSNNISNIFNKEKLRENPIIISSDTNYEKNDKNFGLKFLGKNFNSRIRDKQASPSENNIVIKNSLTEILFLFFCKCSKSKNVKIKNEMFEKGFKKINYHMNIFNYIKKMHDIEMLKNLMLNEEQIKIFNFLSIPSILENSLENIDTNISEREIEDLYNSYNHICKKKGNSKINKKLIEAFDSKFKAS